MKKSDSPIPHDGLFKTFRTTIALKLEQKGAEKGRAQGIQEGRMEGLVEGEREATMKIARTMLQNGIDNATVLKITGLSENTLKQIRH